ncbi:hypothetical protein GCM10028807_54710 [Spirosoma daeguense]
MNTTKTCSKCSYEKLLTEFHKQKRGKYGVRSICKTCSANHRKEYCSNPEIKKRHRLEQAQWRKDNPNRAKEINRKSWRKHSATLNKTRRERYVSDPDFRAKSIEYDKRYKESGRRSATNRLNPNHRLRAKKFRQENKEHVSQTQKQYRKRIWNPHEKLLRLQLDKSYVVQVIKKQTHYALKTEEIPESLIELKRQTIALKRQLKKQIHE